MSNKENISANKFEGPKLRMEPMQMKKKKKGGGYNLRKSLAWNRSFFTEEGVLDPEELSLISGTLFNSSREGIPTIHEEATDSLAEDYQFNNDSANLQALEKNLFKGTLSSCCQETRETVYLRSKHTSPACSSQASTSMASLKVFSTNGVKKAGSIAGASPRPLPSPSLKRSANITASKPVAKESKLPKLPVSKPRQVSTFATNKSNIRGTGSSMKTQILRPVVSKQRTVEPKCYPKSVKISNSKAKDGSESLLIKSSASHSKRNKVNPPSNIPASNQLCLPMVKEVGNSVPKVIPDDGPHIIKVDSSENQGATAKLGDTLPSNNVIRGRTLQDTKTQSHKPSGLRMPSPSLGFFHQSKASASDRFSRRVVVSNPRVEKLSDARLLQTPAKVLQVLDSHVLSANPLVSSSRYDLNDLSTISITSDIGEDARKNGKEILHKYEYFGLETDVQTMMRVTGNEEKFQHHAKNEIGIIFEEDRKTEMDDSKMVLVTEPSKQFMEDGYAKNCILGDRSNRKSTGSRDFQFLSRENFAQCTIGTSGTRINIQSPGKEEKSSNSAVTEHDLSVESPRGDMNNSEVLNSAMLRSNFVSCSPDLHQPSVFLIDNLEAPAGEKLAVPDVDNPSILEEGSSEKLIGCSHSSACEKIGNKNFENVKPTSFELEDSIFLAEHMYASQSEDSVIRDDMTDNSHMQDSLVQIPNLTLTANTCCISCNQSLDTDFSNPSGTLLDPQTDCLKVEQMSKIIHGLPSADCRLLEKDTGPEEYQKNVFEMPPFDLSDEGGKSKIDNSGTEISNVFFGLKSEGFHTNKIIRPDFLRNPKLGSVQVSSPVANQDCGLHRNASSVAHLSDESSSLDLLSSSSEVSEFLADKKNLRILEPAGQDLFDVSYLEKQVADTSLSLESKICDEDQRSDLQSLAETDHAMHGNPWIELERHCGLKVVNVMEKDKSQMDSANTGSVSQTGDDPEHFAGSYVPVSTIIPTSVTHNQCVEGANCTVESEQPELSRCCILIGEVPEGKNELLPGDCSYKERVVAETSEESIVSTSGARVSHKHEPCESELKSSIAICNATLKPLPAQANVDDKNECHEGPCIEELRSSCDEIQHSFEKNTLSSGCQLKHDAHFGGLLHQGELTSPGRKNQPIGLTDGVFTDETQPEVCQNRDSFFGDTKCDFVALCQEKDEKATAEMPFSGSKKFTRTSNERNLTILPPRNAVPFSDEWLAAIEAAGEEILTKKSGAVQNSPPDKSLPESSPWSPVKKNNVIGPYDCTKFTNN